MNNIQEYFHKYTNGKYLSKQELMYRVQSNKQDFSQVWEQMLTMRLQKSVELPLHDQDGKSFWFMTPAFLLKKMNQIDSVAKRQLEEIASMEIHKELLLESMFDEAFYSSVIEGAFSTKKRAKVVVQHKKPKDKSEQMIMNNYLGMMYVLENMNQSIDEESILTLHKTLTKDTLSEENITEKYRTGSVYVKSDMGEIIYEAPDVQHVEPMMKNLIQFIQEEDDAQFIHPIIKASIIHFYIGFIHPFFDGNGRVARALAYMYLLKHGYDFFKFFSISSIISKHRKKYYQSYLLSEEPERDLTYFIDTQIDIAQESIEEVINRLSSIYNQELLNDRLEKDYVILSKRQKKFLHYMDRKDSNLITVKDYEKQFKVAYETARKDLNELDGLGLVKKIKKGKKYIYIFQGMKGYMGKE
jgi:Fic family protein